MTLEHSSFYEEGEQSARHHRWFEETAEGQRAFSIRFMFFVAGGIVVLVALLAVFVLWLLDVWQWRYLLAFVVPGVVLGISLIGAGQGYFLYREFQYEEGPDVADKASAKEAAREHKENERRKDLLQLIQNSTTLEFLVHSNREDNVAYHRIVKEQAERSGRLSHAAMAVGFLVLVAGSISIVFISDLASKMAVGVLASLGTVLSSYIARTFQREKEAALQELYRYWGQPHATSYILAAERIAKDIPDKEFRIEQQARIIEQVLRIAVDTDSIPHQDIRSRKPTARQKAPSTKEARHSRSSPEGTSHTDGAVEPKSSSNSNV